MTTAQILFYTFGSLFILLIFIPMIISIDKRTTRLAEFGLNNNTNDSWLEFHYKKALEKQEQEYEKDIDKLQNEIKELKETTIIQEATINVLDKIIKQSLTGAIKENTDIIQELEELEKENKRKGELI